MKTLICVALTMCAITSVSTAQPTPAIVQGPDQWTVDVTFEHPQQIMLQRTGKPEVFWYTILSVTNNTAQDVHFFPKCELMTDTFQILPAGRNVPPAVFQLIKRRHKHKYPLLERLERTSSRILQGEEHAKDLALIWPDFDAQATAIQIFIAGLSNETAVIEHPTEKDQAGQAVKVYLRKTLELAYKLKGDPALRPYLKVTYKDKDWVMR